MRGKNDKSPVDGGLADEECGCLWSKGECNLTVEKKN